MGLTLQPHNYGPTPLHAWAGEMATFSMDVIGDGSSAYTSHTGTVTIKDGAGNTIRTLRATQTPDAQGNAHFNFTWDGKDDNGSTVKPGDYAPTFSAEAQIAGGATSQTGSASFCSGTTTTPPTSTGPCDDGQTGAGESGTGGGGQLDGKLGGPGGGGGGGDDDQHAADDGTCQVDDSGSGSSGSGGGGSGGGDGSGGGGSGGGDGSAGGGSSACASDGTSTSGGSTGDPRSSGNTYSGPTSQNPMHVSARWLESFLDIPNINVSPRRIDQHF